MAAGQVDAWREVAGSKWVVVLHRRDSVSDRDHEERRDVAGLFEHPYDLHRRPEVGPCVTHEQHIRWTEADRCRMAYEDLELVAHVIRLKVVDFGAWQWRVIVLDHGLLRTFFNLHPEDAEARLRDRRVERGLDAHRQDAPRVERVDDAVVPEPGRGEVRASPRARRSRGSAPRRRRARASSAKPPRTVDRTRAACGAAHDADPRSSARTTGSAADRPGRPSRSCRPRTRRR